MKAQVLIVGSGLTGATIARCLVDQGISVIVLDRRSEIGGNLADYTDPHGIRIHKYGPHYFRTGCLKIWQFVTRFDSFYNFEARIATEVDGRLYNWPILEKDLCELAGDNWRYNLGSNNIHKSLESACLEIMPRLAYEMFVKEYNEKQWGTTCDLLSASLCKRFDVRSDDETRLTPHKKFQGLPNKGYSAWLANMLNGIEVILNCDYLKCKTDIQSDYVVFTGPIDEFFNYDLGRLKYRAQHRTKEIYMHSQVQSYVQVNNPQHSGGEHIRTIEWKHLTNSKVSNDLTILTRETPYTPDDANCYEYPFMDDENHRLFNCYKKKAQAISRTIICGRLGEYRYYDMDQAIGSAFYIFRKLLNRIKNERESG